MKSLMFVLLFMQTFHLQEAAEMKVEGPKGLWVWPLKTWERWRVEDDSYPTVDGYCFILRGKKRRICVWNSFAILTVNIWRWRVYCGDMSEKKRRKRCNRWMSSLLKHHTRSKQSRRMKTKMYRVVDPRGRGRVQNNNGGWNRKLLMVLFLLFPQLQNIQQYFIRNNCSHTHTAICTLITTVSSQWTHVVTRVQTVNRGAQFLNQAGSDRTCLMSGENGTPQHRRRFFFYYICIAR